MGVRRHVDCRGRGLCHLWEGNASLYCCVWAGLGAGQRHCLPFTRPVLITPGTLDLDSPTLRHGKLRVCVCRWGCINFQAFPLRRAEVLHPVFIIYFSFFLWQQRNSPEMNELAYSSDPSYSQCEAVTCSPCLSLSCGSRSSEHLRLPLQHLLPGCDQRALLSSAEAPTSRCFPADTGRRPRVHSHQCPCTGSAGPANRSHRPVHIMLVVARYLEYH